MMTSHENRQTSKPGAQVLQRLGDALVVFVREVDHLISQSTVKNYSFKSDHQPFYRSQLR